MNYNNVLLRLSDRERQELQLLVAALNVSEYTDDVDDIRRRSFREDRMSRAIRDLFDTVLGLYIASGSMPREAKAGFPEGKIYTSATLDILSSLFEVLRRHKRLNPFSNRSEFGKLTMLLQDLQRPAIRRHLNYSHDFITPVQTVGDELRRLRAEGLLEDADLKEFLNASGKSKADFFQRMLARYGNTGNVSDIERCIRSIDDVYQFVESNVKPLQWMREIIETDFVPLESGSKYSLSIQSGMHGSVLNHDHATQCKYVLESLLLWEIVQQNIFNFWQDSEDDMLKNNGEYLFTNTGQGYHRMCRADKSYSRMTQCVKEAEKRMRGWVGIKVIHVGDRDVPNPLVFIDKYTVIPRIVRPIMDTVLALERIFSDESAEVYPGLRNFLRSKYNTYKELRMTILSDFFRHGFDGSGDDGGNCIDGRLTSAWNWCHQLEKKPFYDAFVLTGFNGFD
ncbi:putative Protein of unknown function (DUF2009) [Trypanosoma vivax]|uniref:Non-canonical E2 ubiquitin-conjugating enzyme C-terminal domain-containing protein n=1 Tax=Trypanosoma vivax (strain Y486) TaxID=1055687 RepID=G0UCL1_TRYVY|nr:hypothetical protein TRVL_05947 [Trypanosoma vivax]KAH8608096.1 putative Protein of unknown function (DUF2009) [Trypanosoma vivax]CCC53571.1 conserved hypothetical protein [Trypanosoma vivax Y486]